MLLEANGVSWGKPFPRPDMGPAFLVQQASFWTRCCSSQHVKCILHSFIPVGWATLAVQPQHVEGPFNPDNEKKAVQVCSGCQEFNAIQMLVWHLPFYLPCHVIWIHIGQASWQSQVGASGTAECIQMSLHFVLKLRAVFKSKLLFKQIMNQAEDALFPQVERKSRLGFGWSNMNWTTAM